PHVDMFFKRLLSGAPFLEACYYCQPTLSWQTTFIGDPLYRPFAVSLDEQIARLEADKRPDVAWAYVRKINQLLAAGKAAEAEQFCRAKAETIPSFVLYEKLGDMLKASGQYREAIAPYRSAMVAANGAYRYIRVATKLASAYQAEKQLPQALQIFESLAT